MSGFVKVAVGVAIIIVIAAWLDTPEKIENDLGVRGYGPPVREQNLTPEEIAKRDPENQILKERQETEQKKVQAELEVEFKADRTKIVSWLKHMVESKSWVAAVAWGERFKDVKDAEFQELYRRALIGSGQQQAKMAEMDAAREQRSAAFRESIETSSLSAISFCKNLVRQELKAPASAKFEFLPEVTTSEINETYMISSYIDAENSFGAKVRTNYFCQLNYIDGREWSVHTLRLEE